MRELRGRPLRIQISKNAFRPKLDSWREQAAEGDDKLFCRRLRAEGLDPCDLPGIIGGPDFTTLEVPEWCLFLNEAWSSASEWSDADIFDVSGEIVDLPFYSLARPFVRAAEWRLIALLSGVQTLDDSAIAQAVDHLARS